MSDHYEDQTLLDGVQFGVGFSVDGWLTVDALAPGCSADKSGSVQVGDRVVAVDGNADLTPDTAKDLILGRQGTYATISFKRREGPNTRTFKVQLMRGTSDYIFLVECLRGLEDQIRDLQAENARLHEVRGAEKDFTAFGSTRDETRARLAEVEEENSSLKRRHHEEIETLLDRLEKLEGADQIQSSSKDAKIDELESENHRLRHEVHMLRESIVPAKLQSNTDLLSSKLAGLEAENASLRDEMQKMKLRNQIHRLNIGTSQKVQQPSDILRKVDELRVENEWLKRQIDMPVELTSETPTPARMQPHSDRDDVASNYTVPSAPVTQCDYPVKEPVSPHDYPFSQERISPQVQPSRQAQRQPSRGTPQGPAAESLKVGREQREKRQDYTKVISPRKQGPTNGYRTPPKEADKFLIPGYFVFMKSCHFRHVCQPCTMF